MRIHFTDLARLKTTAKLLVRLSPTLQLSTVHESLASALGYRDWHELSVSPLTGQGEHIRSVSEITRLVVKISEALGMSDSDVQYAVSKARMLTLETWGLDQQLAVRTAIWRHDLFGPPARAKAGSVVKVRGGAKPRIAYLRQYGRPSYLFYDTGPGMCSDFEVVTPRERLADFVPSRLWLPYGYWTLKDGSEVFFSRDYLPLWRATDRSVERLDPWLWINRIASQTHFTSEADTIDWSGGAARDLAIQHLERRRALELPKLVDVMPHLFRPDIEDAESVPAAVELMRKQHDRDELPAYAAINPYLR